MATRIVSFLGTGDSRKPTRYEPCRSEYRGQIPDLVTPLHDLAVALCCPGPVSLILLGTKEAREVWFGPDQLYMAELERSGVVAKLGFSLLGPGASTEERWEIFGAVRAALTADPLELKGPDGRDQGTEQAAPERILLDITHGFRSQPFFAASALTYELSQRRRHPARSYPTIELLYSAFEQRHPDSNAVPVWDLSQFLDVVRWDAGIDALMRFGRGDDLGGLVEELSRQMAQEAINAGGIPKTVKAFGEAARLFSEGLATVRTPALLRDLSPALGRAIRDLRPQLIERIPPLAEHLDELENWASGIRAARVSSSDGLDAALKLAQLYEELERYPEMAITLREWLVTAWAFLQGEPAEPWQQGKIFAPARQAAERDLTSAATEPGSASSDLTTRFRRIFKNLGDDRNDIEHGAMRSNRKEGRAIRRDLASHLKDLQSLWKDAKPAICAAEERASRIGHGPKEGVTEHTLGFLNCSNHPVADWPAEQVAAALGLGYGPPIDLDGGFPPVDPELPTGAVEELAEETTGRILAAGAQAVHLAGEFSLAFALVSRLQCHGIHCYSATTRRISAANLQADGTIDRHSAFRFVAWRRYPSLSPTASSSGSSHLIGPAGR